MMVSGEHATETSATDAMPHIMIPTSTRLHATHVFERIRPVPELPELRLNRRIMRVRTEHLARQSDKMKNIWLVKVA